MTPFLAPWFYLPPKEEERIAMKQSKEGFVGTKDDKDSYQFISLSCRNKFCIDLRFVILDSSYSCNINSGLANCARILSHWTSHIVASIILCQSQDAGFPYSSVRVEIYNSSWLLGHDWNPQKYYFKNRVVDFDLGLPVPVPVPGTGIWYIPVRRSSI
jgi:hypothetical protein